MPARVGEMLVKIGALTEEQLKQVLAAQSIYGGKFGTNLVEMGFVREEDLAVVLSEKLGAPFVDATELDAIPKQVLDLIPLEMVQRYTVLPVSLDGRRLLLAMADPSDFKAVEEIGFLTGLVIVPRVCSELRLKLALERYYGIKRQVRYIPVAGGARSRFSGSVSKGQSHADAESPAGMGPKTGRVKMQLLAERLAGAGSEAQVVSILMVYLGGEFDRGAFMTLKPGHALGVQAIADGFEIDGFAGYAVELDRARQLKRAVQENSVFLGEFQAQGADGELLTAMGGAPPAPALVLPISVAGQVAAVLCVNDGKGRLAGGIFDLQRIAAMAELAFEMIRIRKKIKSV